MKTNRNSKRASIAFGDAEAFKLVTEMWRDLECYLPQELYEHVSGRFRRRDYEFVVESFPSYGLSLMQQPQDGGVILLNGKTFSMGENPQRTAELVYAVSHYLKKYEFESSTVYTDEYRAHASRFSFRKAEKWCYRLNRNLAAALESRPLLLTEMRRTLRWLLGDDPDIPGLIDRGYFGPGVNVGVKGDQTDSQVKFSLPLTITRALRTQFDTAARLMPATLFHYGISSYLHDSELVPPPGIPGGGWEYERFAARGAMDLYYHRLEMTRGCKVALVPKDAKTLRAIAAEPMVNSYFQNGLGSLLVDRLLRKTPMLDLRDQTRNRVMAKAGSNVGSLATIDLSSASDTISKSIARALLPKKWYRLLSLLRSPRYCIDGEWRKANKLSSMGNGFTFPIESALFYSISRSAIVVSLVEDQGLSIHEARRVASSHGHISQGIYEPSVYGDDIIVRSDMFDAVCKALELCGFWINRRKSYSQGLYRESCGHDYYGGNYVRPVFLKRKISLITQVFTLVNQLAHPEGLGWLTERWDVSFRNYFRYVASFTHRFKGLSSTFGPFCGRIEDRFISVLIDELRSRDHISWDSDGQRWVYHPITVSPVLGKNPSELGYALKVFHRNQRRSPREFSNTTYALVVRGKFKLKYPKRGTDAKGLASLPSVELGEVPGNLDRWLAILARYIDLHPLLKGW